MKKKIVRCCPHCGQPLSRSPVPGYVWACEYCEEDFYNFETVERTGYKKFFVTLYTEYPIFEPAEGGYYYAGRKAMHSKKFARFSSAKRYTINLARDRDMEAYGYCLWADDDYRRGKYIGIGSFIQIERKCKVAESGWQPYC